jgi:LEA14-like dessication related protein
MNLRSSFKKILLLSVLSFIFQIPDLCFSEQAFQKPGLYFSEQTFQKPVVNLKKVRIIGIDQTAVFLEGTLAIFNPNDLSSRFSGYNYQVEVEGQRLLTGTSDQPFTIPAQGTFSITIPATILLADLLTLSNKELFNRDLKYRLTGTVLLDSWIGKLPLPFSYEGTLNLSERLRENVREFLEGL